MEPSSQYFRKTASDLYAAVPVYRNHRTGAEIFVSYKPGDALLKGCTCSAKKGLCQPHKGCTCEGNISYHPTRDCDFDGCKPCKKDRVGCKVRSGCECQRNAYPLLPVCTPACHGGGRRCECMHNVSPREDSVCVVEHDNLGCGVRAKKEIKAGWCVGLYAGELMMGLELFALAGCVEIAEKGVLGVSAYQALASRDFAQDDDAASAMSVDEGPTGAGLCRIDRILAGRVETSGSRSLLIQWEGHIAPSWTEDTGAIEHSLSFANLSCDLPDDGPEFQKAIGPEAYTMCGGVFHPLECCNDEECLGIIANENTLDYRVFVDAFKRGNFTRYINHSCDPVLKSFYARIGCDPLNPPVPLFLALRTIRKGEYLTFSYWDMCGLSKEQRLALRKNRPEKKDTYNNCCCGSAMCTGYISLPPRQALAAAGVPDEHIRILWNDRPRDAAIAV
ncbi:unnamed protein product [Peniophora sp. CBMAI 1063]|nr:unnamed protein product [Peniophora sp. CBMAI 1063]